MVVKTAVLQEVADSWLSEMQHRTQTLYSGTIWLSRAGLLLSRLALPPE